MELLLLINQRRSIRKFTRAEVTEDIEKKIINNILLIPSAGNLQAYGIVSVRNNEIKQQLFRAAYGQDAINQASLVLVFFADQKQSSQRYKDRGKNLYSIQDATIATTYAHLISTDLGLGSVWIGAFQTDEVQNILKLPVDKIPISILPIGYPDESTPPRGRRKYEEIVIKM